MKATRGALLCLGILMGCDAVDDATVELAREAPRIEVFRADLPNSAVKEGDFRTIDLRAHALVYVFDRSAGDLDFDRFNLICPNGSEMPMKQWLELQAGELLVERPIRFSVSRNLPPPSQNGCDLECTQCPDGAWSCTDPCEDASDKISPPRSRHRLPHGWGGLPWPPLPSPPTQPEPPAPPMSPIPPTDPADPSPQGSNPSPGEPGGDPTGGSSGGSGSTGGSSGSGGSSGGGSGSGSPAGGGLGGGGGGGW